MKNYSDIPKALIALTVLLLVPEAGRTMASFDPVPACLQDSDCPDADVNDCTFERCDVTEVNGLRFGQCVSDSSRCFFKGPLPRRTDRIQINPQPAQEVESVAVFDRLPIFKLPPLAEQETSPVGPNLCASLEDCEDGNPCTNDVCKPLQQDLEPGQVLGLCLNTPIEDCAIGIPPPQTVEQPPAPPPPPAPEPEPPAEAVPPPAPVEVPVVENPPAPPPPAPEIPPAPLPPPPSFALSLTCSAPAEDKTRTDDGEVIFAVDRSGKPTRITLEAVPAVEGESAALAKFLSGAEKIELRQTGGSTLVVLKESEAEGFDAALGGDTIVVAAGGTPGFVPTSFRFDAPIPVSPGRDGVETFDFTARLVGASGETLATASGACPVGLQIFGGGAVGGCSLIRP